MVKYGMKQPALKYIFPNLWQEAAKHPPRIEKARSAYAPSGTIWPAA